MRAAPQQQQQPLRFSLARGRGAGGLQLQPALQPFSALRAAGRGGYRTVPHTLSYDSGDDSDGSDGPPRLPRSRCGQSCLVVCVVIAVAAGSVAIFRALTHRDVPKVSSRPRGGRPPPPPPRQFMAVRASSVVEGGKRYGGKPAKRVELIPLAEARPAPAPPFSPVLSWSWSPPPPPPGPPRATTTTRTPASVPLPPLAPFPSPPPPPPPPPPPKPPRPARRHRSPPPPPSPPPPLPSTLASVVGVAVPAEQGSGRTVR